VDRLTALLVLRWRTELRFLRRAPERIAGFLIAIPLLLLFSAFAAAFAFFAVRSLAASDPGLLMPVLSMAATAIGLFWVLSPLLGGGGLAEADDLSRLLHFPIPLPALVASSFVATLLKPAVITRLPIMAAIAAAVSESASALPLAFLGVGTSFAFIVAAAQASGLLLHGLSRSRRFQDLAVLLVLGVGFVLSVAPALFWLSDAGRPAARFFRWLVAVDAFAVSPFAWGVRAAVHAGRGEPLGFLAFAGGGLLAVLAAAAFSAALIARSYRGETMVSAPRVRAGARGGLGLPGAVGAILEKDLALAWREPASKAALFMGFVSPVVWLLIISQGRGHLSPRGVLAIATVIGASSIGTNVLGLEGKALAQLLAFPVERWRVLAGKNLGGLVQRLPAFLGVLAISALLAPAALLPVTATILAATYLIAAAADNYVSILFPVGVRRRRHEGAARQPRGLGAAVIAAALFAATLLMAAPFAVLAWLPLLFGQPWWWLFALPLALAGAASVYGMLLSGAAGLLARRERDLLERVLGES
jgi:hypothetical protein